MWLGEQITSKGVGNGISIIIFAGIVAGIPSVINQIYAQQFENAGEQSFLTYCNGSYNCYCHYCNRCWCYFHS